MGYCNKCGKEINYDSVVCVECVAKAKAEAENVRRDTYGEQLRMPPHMDFPFPPMWQMCEPNAQKAEESGKKNGFGMALSAIIISVVAFVISFIALNVDDVTAIPNLVLLFVVPGIVISLIFGIKSMGRYNKTKGEKPTPTLVLGIVSVCLAGLALLFSMIAFSMI